MGSLHAAMAEPLGRALGAAYARARAEQARAEAALESLLADDAWVRETLGADHEEALALPRDLQRAKAEWTRCAKAAQRGKDGRTAEAAFMERVDEPTATRWPADAAPPPPSKHKERAAVALGLDELRWTLEEGIDWDAAVQAPAGSRARARAVAQLRQVVDARRELRDAYDALRAETAGREEDDAAARDEEDARWRNRCARFLAKHVPASPTPKQAKPAEPPLSKKDWLPDTARQAAQAHAPEALRLLDAPVRALCASPADAMRVASERHELRRCLFELALVSGPAQCLMPPSPDATPAPNANECIAQCRLAHAVLCGEVGVGAGGGAATRAPLRVVVDD